MRKIFLLTIWLISFSTVAFSAHYIHNNNTTYIGETQFYYCYIYETDVNMIVRISDFPVSGNWIVTVALAPKYEKTREKYINLLKNDIDRDNFKTLVFPVRDNKLWAFAMRFMYDKATNRLFMEDNFWLNSSGAIIAQTKTEIEECKTGELLDFWRVQKLIDQHIHARYQDEYERQNTTIR